MAIDYSLPPSLFLICGRLPKQSCRVSGDMWHVAAVITCAVRNCSAGPLLLPGDETLRNICQLFLSRVMNI